jgi:hypothetical protein
MSSAIGFPPRAPFSQHAEYLRQIRSLVDFGVWGGLL